jgi:tetratricopeptide (TPR) repeat protein
MIRRHARAWVLIAGVLGGCRDARECLDLAEAQRYEAAVQRCEAVYAADGDAEAGMAAARAHYFLGHPDEVLAWRDRLVKAGKARPGVEALAAAVHQQRGEIAQAERAYRRDLELSRAAGDHRRAADNLYRLFYLAWGSASYRETYLLASESVQEAARSQDPKIQAGAAQALFTSLYEIGDLQGAHQALETARELIDKEDPAARANLLNSLGAVLAAEGRLALARRHFEQALQLEEGLPKELLRGIHLNLAEVHLDLGDVERAAYHLDRVREHLDPGQPAPAAFHCFRARIETERGRFEEASRSLAAALAGDPEPEWAWQLEYRQGLLAEARGDLPAAEAAYRRSIAVVEELRRSLGFDELKAWLLDEKRQPFEALFRVQARAGRAREALATAEHAQARTLLDAFLHASSSAGSGAGASLQRIAGLESLLPAMSESPVATPQPLDRVLAAFGDRHALVYFDAGEELWLISVAAIAGEGARLFGPGPAAEVRRLAERFLADPDDARTAERLGELLLPPSSLPNQGRTLYIVADGLLGNLPFAALRRGGRYLVEDHALVSIPSLSALTVLEGSGREHPGPPLVLADPQGNLPAAQSEGLEVARLLGGTPRTARSAVSAELRKASGARSLHLATHTGLDPGGAWLQLADRRVGASEIVKGRIGPRLVVLASCASGVRPGRQMWGSLGAAFLAAGSRAVLASLWSIEDEPSRDLVLRFYREGGASEPAAALARTQRVAIGQGLSPQQWAPFVLFGSDRPLSEALDRKGGKT